MIHDSVYFQLSEISIDLAEEHTTSNKATELLDSETVGRMQLERELKELTVSTVAMTMASGS